MRLSGLDYFPKFYSAGILDNIACTLEDNISHPLKDPEAREANYIMMEYIGGINLREFCEKYWNAKARSSPDTNPSLTNNPLSSADISVFLRIMRNCACAYECMHKHDIVHGDAKSSNIMLSNREAQDQKVIILDFDFSFAAKAEQIDGFSLLLRREDISSKYSGTVLFKAPETLKGSEGIGTSQYSDIWGIGCTLYRMLGGVLPFETGSMSGIMWAIKHKEPERLSSTAIDQKISDLVHSCLEKDWRNRPNATQLKEGLEEIMRRKGVEY